MKVLRPLALLTAVPLGFAPKVPCARNFAPGYHLGDECALCNAAVGMKLKLAPPTNPPTP